MFCTVSVVLGTGNKGRENYQKRDPFFVPFTTGPAVRIAASAPWKASKPGRGGGPPGLPTWTRQVTWHWLGDWLRQWIATG